MEKNSNKENLISIDEIIIKAKILGINLGKGNPRERLRYLTKIGLIPHAERKSFNGQRPNGAYPEYVIEILKEIDQKIKAGKSIQEIKKEKERKELLSSYNKIGPIFDINIKPLKLAEKEKEPVKRKKIASIYVSFLVIVITGLLLGFLFKNYEGEKIFTNKFPYYFLSALNFFQKFQEVFQNPYDSNQKFFAQEQKDYSFSEKELYLTINAETDINAPLRVKEEITAPLLSLNKNNFSASFVTGDLTANRVYTFPDASGTVCLTTGNCFDLGGRVSIGNSSLNRLVKFIGPNQLGNSSFEDFYNGIALTIDTFGKVGVGRRNPQYPLHVEGRIQATGDICTDLAGGRCLSTLILGGAPSSPPFSGISGTGATNYLPLWNSSDNLGNSVIYQSGSNIGIGTTTTSGARLTLSGNALFSSLTLPQLSLKYDDSNYLNFSISSSASLLESSNNLILNSLTGEIRLGDDVNLFDAFRAKIQAATFISTTTDSTVRKSGELVFRASIPIFRFPIPAQSTSTNYIVVSKTFSSTDSLNSITPAQLPGANRVYSFLINFADDISTSSFSNWRVYRPAAATTTFAFDFQGQNLVSMEIGNSFMSATTTLPDNDWQLETKVPLTDRRIRIFNIFLLAFDEIK